MAVIDTTRHAGPVRIAARVVLQHDCTHQSLSAIPEGLGDPFKILILMILGFLDHLVIVSVAAKLRV